jgi:hypothetical protein
LVSDDPFTVALNPVSRVVTPGFAPATDFDSQYASFTDTVVQEVQGVVSGTSTTPEWSVVGPATIASNGRVTATSYSSNITVNVQVGRIKKRAGTFVSTVSGGVYSELTGWTPGTLAHHIDAAIKAAVAGKTPSPTTMNVAPSDIRNTSLWVPWDVSAIHCPVGARWHQGAMIHPRFSVLCHHWPWVVANVVGSTHALITNGNVVQTRTVTAGVDLGGDQMLVMFDSPFTDITPIAIPPANWSDKFRAGSTVASSRLPVVKGKREFGGSQGFQLGLGFLNSGLGVSNTARPSELAPWYLEWVSGDSGSFVGVPVNGELVLLGKGWTGGGVNDDGMGTLVGKTGAIQSAMETLLPGSSSALRFPNISAFTSRP